MFTIRTIPIPATSYSLGGELGVGNVAHSGVDFSMTDVYTTTNKWTDKNDAAPSLQFHGQETDKLYEPYYFKEAGEKSVDPADPDLFASIGSFEPVRIGLEKAGRFECRATGKFDGAGDIPDASSNFRKSRQKRNQSISLLSIAEARNFGLQPDLYSTTPSGTTVSDKAKDHHIGEVTTLRTDGSRYVYGIPAYNTRQEETTFSMGSSGAAVTPSADKNCNTGLITYVPNSDNSTSNTNGQDNFYSNTILPAYAHSYLLTAVLSPDYVDIDNVKGPSSGDLGSYTRFNYSKVGNNNDVSNSFTYKWRVPVGENQANYNENLKTDFSDDQGNYIYGEKELWYLNSVETKNYIAIFTKENRSDAYGVADKDGKLSTDVASQLLKKISLYSKPDYDAKTNPNQLTTATPIKEVNFEYDYSLCPGVTNSTNASGKLTLKKIYFTYGNSKKGKLSPYEFIYSSYNPQYNLKGYDRWGNYKPNPLSTQCAVSPTDPLATYEFPYVDQDQATADNYTSAWSLSKINLPSGGTINVNYQSDDYAYVQDKQAMQMFSISNITNGEPTASNVEGGDELHLFDGNTSNLYLSFKLKETTNNSVDAFRKKYLDGIENLYFKCYTKVNGNGYEYVSGYAKIEDSGFIPPSNGSQYGWIKLKSVTLEKNTPQWILGVLNPNYSQNPISKTAWQFARLHTPWAYGFKRPDANLSVRGIFESLADASMIKNVVQTFQGPNGALRDIPNEFIGRDCYKKRSFIRLLNPNKKKLGGGSRVKELSITDEWAGMTQAANLTSFKYGQEYDYTKIENGEIISSGVAAYEPMLGGEENPFKLPVPFGDKEAAWLAPHNDFYMEEPFGESFFPAASVGYSRITVKNLHRDNVSHNATGSLVHTFYTAQDFPLITKRTDLDARSRKTRPILRLFKVAMKDYMTVSQGYSVELNDMHGKPRSQEVYAEGQKDPISKVEYFYKANGNRLDNQVAVINSNGSIENKMVGVDYDFIADMRQQTTDIASGGANMNLSVFVVGIFPGIVPTILPSFSQEHTCFRSAVVTKVINRYGILEKVTATDLGSIVSTENVAYDAQTGDVLLTKTTNEFNDKIYSFTYPAHWKYDQMGPAYKNVGAIITVNFNEETGTIAGSGQAKDYFTLGDEVSIGSIKYWVSEINNNNNNNNTIKLIYEIGSPYKSGGQGELVKILRSGRRNQQSTPIAAITSVKNPIDKNGVGNGHLDPHLAYLDVDQNFNIDPAFGILNASATEFSDGWRTFCDCLPVSAAGRATLGKGIVKGSDNPYLLGIKGNWKAQKSYLYLTERVESNLNNNTSIRTDGAYKDFSPFWNFVVAPAPGTWQKNDSKWTFTSEVKEFSPYNYELENRDALNRFSAAQYGYNNSLPVAVSSNSQYKESGFDNFEDYDYGTCANGHFSFKGAGADLVISGTQAHTGKRSIKVGANKSISITKTIIPITTP